jgi:hypothetical protein
VVVKRYGVVGAGEVVGWCKEVGRAEGMKGEVAGGWALGLRVETIEGGDVVLWEVWGRCGRGGKIAQRMVAWRMVDPGDQGTVGDCRWGGLFENLEKVWLALHNEKVVQTDECVW